MMTFLIIMILIIAFILYALLWALPLYGLINLFLWSFHFTFRITILQSAILGILISAVIEILSKNKGG